MRSISFVVYWIPNEACSMTDGFGLGGQDRILNSDPKNIFWIVDPGRLVMVRGHGKLAVDCILLIFLLIYL